MQKMLNKDIIYLKSIFEFLGERSKKTTFKERKQMKFS